MHSNSLMPSYVWGAIADHKGRKPVLIVSLLLVGLSTAMFGFSVSFEMALIVRFLAGLFSGKQLWVFNKTIPVCYIYLAPHS